MAPTFSIFLSLVLILILSAVSMGASGAMAGAQSLKPSEHFAVSILAAAELYNPTTKTWQQGGTLRHPCFLHAAVALPIGLVMVAGGYGPDGTLASAEVYAPKRNTWYPIADLKQARNDHTLTFIGPDTILAAGGRHSSPTATSQVYHASNVPILVPHVYIPHLTRPGFPSSIFLLTMGN